MSPEWMISLFSLCLWYFKNCAGEFLLIKRNMWQKKISRLAVWHWGSKVPCIMLASYEGTNSCPTASLLTQLHAKSLANVAEGAWLFATLQPRERTGRKSWFQPGPTMAHGGWGGDIKTEIEIVIEVETYLFPYMFSNKIYFQYWNITEKKKKNLTSLLDRHVQLSD